MTLDTAAAAPPQVPRAAKAALAAVIVAQWLGTSLWFSPAGAAQGLMERWALQPAAFAWLIAATQLGFITGSLALGLSGAADRWPASRVFALSCLLGAALNVALVLGGVSYPLGWGLRFAVGVALAGIYPLGMKMVVQWVGGKPALALAWLVAMLTLGTAMPHALRAYGVVWPWEWVIGGASVLAVAGGAVVAWVGDGPYRAGAAQAPRVSGVFLRQLAALAPLRAAALGYFGHMWELYAFWAVVPALCLAMGPLPRGGWAWAPAAVIAAGAAGCVAGGWASRHWGSARTAAAALAGSGLLCLLYPLLPAGAVALRMAVLVCWGALVVADSPQFSALSARAVPAQWLGAALVLQNGLGFLVSVVSIVALGSAYAHWGDKALWLLVPGPVLGLWAMRPLWNVREHTTKP